MKLFKKISESRVKKTVILPISNKSVIVMPLQYKHLTQIYNDGQEQQLDSILNMLSIIDDCVDNMTYDELIKLSMTDIDVLFVEIFMASHGQYNNIDYTCSNIVDNTIFLNYKKEELDKLKEELKTLKSTADYDVAYYNELNSTIKQLQRDFKGINKNKVCNHVTRQQSDLSKYYISNNANTFKLTSPFDIKKATESINTKSKLNYNNVATIYLKAPTVEHFINVLTWHKRKSDKIRKTDEWLAYSDAKLKHQQYLVDLNEYNNAIINKLPVKDFRVNPDLESFKINPVLEFATIEQMYIHAHVEKIFDIETETFAYPVLDCDTSQDDSFTFDEFDMLFDEMSIANTSNLIDEVDSFVDSLPVLMLDVDVICDSCKDKKTITLKGIYDFFA